MTDAERRDLNKAAAIWLGFDEDTFTFRQDGRVCCTDPNGCWQVYDFARDWNDMQVVVEQLRGLGWDVEIGTFAKTGRCLCNLYFFTDDVNADVPHEAADAATAPEAVALAALKVPGKAALKVPGKNEQGKKSKCIEEAEAAEEREEKLLYRYPKEIW